MPFVFKLDNKIDGMLLVSDHNCLDIYANLATKIFDIKDLSVEISRELYYSCTYLLLLINLS